MDQSSTHGRRPAACRHVAKLLALSLLLLGLALALPAGALAASAWNLQAEGALAHTYLGGVACANSSDAWAVGGTAPTDANPSTILATTNGGATWKAQSSAAIVGTAFDAVACADASHAWAVGDNVLTYANVILATSDGGATWKAQSPGTVAFGGLYSVACADAGHAWAVGGGGTILATTDGGATWKAQDSGMTGWTQFYSVACADADHAWAVGTTYDTSFHVTGTVILATSDGGATWKAQTSGTLANTELHGVAFADAKHGWVVGSTLDSSGQNSGALVLATSDGGATWKAQTSHLADVLYAVACASASDAWAVGYGMNSGNDILATTDGGATWKAQDSGTGQYLNAVACANPSDAWAVSGCAGQGGGIILATTSAGVSPIPTLAGFSPTSGPVNSPVTLTGKDFSDASTVAFNGLSADFNVDDDTQITAWVPAGASSGAISVTTPGGTATSTTSFTVTATPPPLIVTPQVTLKLAGLVHGVLKLGKRLTAKGSVTPATLVGSPLRLTLQRRQGGSWHTLTSVARTIRAGGAYSWRYKPEKKGSYRLKTTIAKAAGRTAATTAWRTCKVK